MSKEFAIKKEPSKQRGVTYVLLFWSMFFLTTLIAFFQEGIAFFSDHPTTFMNDAEYFVSLALVVVSSVAFLMLVHRNFRVPFHWGWAIAFFLLFACDVVAVFLVPWHLEGVTEVTAGTIAYSYDFTLLERFRYVISFGVSCFLFYLFFAVYPKIFHNTRRLHFFFYLMLLVGFATIVYSLIAEWSLYATMFNPSAEWKVNEVQSFTNNPNTFGFVVLGMMIAIFLLHNRRSHWYWVVLMFVLGVYQLLIGSGSACLASWLLIVAFVIYRFCVTLKYYTGRSLLLFLLFWAAGITLAVLVFTETGGPTSLFARIGKTLKEAQFSENSGQLRIVTWNRIMNTLDTPIRKIFGVGDGQSLTYLGILEDNKLADGSIGPYYAHSGFMQQIFSGGFLRFGFYLVLLARFVYLCIKGMKRKTRLAWPCLICMGALLLRSSFESTSFLQADTKGVTVYLLLVLPIEVDEFLAKHAEIKGYEQQALSVAQTGRFRYRYDFSPLRMAKVALLFVTPICAIGLGAFPQLLRLLHVQGVAQGAYYALFAATFISAPFGFYCIGHHADHEDRAIFGGLLGAGYGLCLLGGLITFNLIPIAAYILAGVILLLTLVAFLFHARSVVHFRERLFAHAYLPHLGILACLAGLASLAYLIPETQLSVYVPIILAIAIFVGYVIVIYTPLGEEFAYPLNVELERFDFRRTALGIPKEEAMEEKQTYYLKAGHMRPAGPGKTFIHRY
ncbi:MAG: hypothetical protein K6E59_06210 [Bacilli bacterium]|nr:hypothetical protein [Bacilli bacterium]